MSVVHTGLVWIFNIQSCRARSHGTSGFCKDDLSVRPAASKTPIAQEARTYAHVDKVPALRII